jgi:hypothetical protein
MYIGDASEASRHHASENPREVELGYIANHRSSNCPDCKQRRSEKQCGLPAKTIAEPGSQEWTSDATQQSTAGSKPNCCGVNPN